MDFGLNPTEKKLYDEIDDYLRAEVTPKFRLGTRFFAEREPEHEAFVRHLTEHAAQRGWLSLQDTQGSVAAGIFLELLGYHDAPIEFYVERDFERLLQLVASDQQQATLSPLVSSGSFRGCVAFTEPGCGSDLAALQTTATRDGEEYVIRGQKAFSTGAHVATHAIAAIRTDPS